jgi:ribosomal protein S18 acetylase RimI-like enzyme
MTPVCERLDPRRHDTEKVGALVYDVDPFLTRVEFGRRPAGIRRIRRLIEADADPFRPGQGLVAMERTAIAGVAFGASGRELADTQKTDAGTLYRCVGLTGMIRLAAAWPVTYRVLSGPPGEEDFYVVIMSVDRACRGRGVGHFLLNSVVEAARERGCRQVTLDVSVENEGAIRFYERHGFGRRKMNRLIPLWDRIGTYTMVKELYDREHIS